MNASSDGLWGRAVVLSATEVSESFFIRLIRELDRLLT